MLFHKMALYLKHLYNAIQDQKVRCAAMEF